MGDISFPCCHHQEDETCSSRGCASSRPGAKAAHEAGFQIYGRNFHHSPFCLWSQRFWGRWNLRSNKGQSPTTGCTEVTGLTGGLARRAGEGPQRHRSQQEACGAWRGMAGSLVGGWAVQWDNSSCFFLSITPPLRKGAQLQAEAELWRGGILAQAVSQLHWGGSHVDTCEGGLGAMLQGAARRTAWQGPM